jgi:hypothetical protein
MKCIFCKANSDGSISIEHILPESLGNKEHLLPRGVVCDSCNNYLSREVEKRILTSGIFRLIRNDRQISSKKGRIPVLGERDNPDLPDYRVMGRFIGKVGIEVLAQRTQNVQSWNEEIVNQPGLDELRDFVRFNMGKEDWPYAYRTLYPVNAVFHENDQAFEVLHEYDLLYTKGYELYIVLVLFGVEFTMNLGGRVLDGYKKWLQENDWKSPLYVGKNP